MRINYIQQIRAFYDSLLTKSLSAGQISLWYALMHVNNKCAWIEWFTVANGVLESLTGLSKGGIESARNTLKQLGYIDFKSNGKKAASYKVLDLTIDIVQESIQDEGIPVYKEKAFEKHSSIQDSSPLNKQNETKLNNKEKDKKEKFSFLSSINSYTKNEKLRLALKEFQSMRIEKKKPISTKTATSRLFNRLNELSEGDDAVKIKMLENSIFNNWQDVYELKDSKKQDSEVGEFNIGTTL